MNKILFHGSPYGGFKSFDDVRPPVFFSPHERVAREYALGKIVGAQKKPTNSTNDPTVYKVSVSPRETIDFRNTRDRDFYVRARKEYFDAHPDDEDRFFHYPRLNAAGFISSKSDTPMFSYGQPLITLFKKAGRNPDSIWLDEGSQDVSLAVFEKGNGKIKILDVHPLTDAVMPLLMPLLMIIGVVAAGAYLWRAGKTETVAGLTTRSMDLVGLDVLISVSG